MSRRSYSTHTWTEICAFWGMLIAAIAYIFGGLFKFLIKWISKLSSTTANLLDTVAGIATLLGHIALLIAVAIPAWQFVKYKRKAWRVIYWIALVVYILGVGFGLLAMIKT